jgi:hypothetical protein
VVALAGLLTGCGSGQGQHVVYQVLTGYFSRFPASTADIIDLGVPELYDQTSQPVRLRSVTPVSWPAAVHIRGLTAYNYKQADGGVIGTFGDLPKQCPRQYVPHPLSVVVTEPHAYSAWFVVFTITIARPGRYHLNRLKISYTTGGHPGWQYQNLDTEIVVTRESRPTVFGHPCGP